MSRFYGKAEQAAARILDAFRTGNLPKALAPIFIRRGDGVPCRDWSWANQLLVALAGFDDARGFRQWEQAGRHVSKGQRGFPILAPMVKKITDDAGQERTRVIGFRHVIVFGLEQTEGAPLATSERLAWLDALPFVEVARAWGLDVRTYQGREGRPLGRYGRSGVIALGVENVSTWAHELIHAADDRLGNLTELGQHWRSETVAELGGAILLEIVGRAQDADRGGCWEYVQAYATDAKVEPIVACQRVLKRTCDAVALILDSAANLALAEVTAA